MRVCFLALALLVSSTLARAANPPLPTALSAYQGKVVYLDFWASWCSPCAQSFPWLNRLQAHYGSRLVVVGVGVDERAADAQRFLKKHPAQFALVADPKGEIAQYFRIQGMPSAVLLDAHGQERYRHEGFKEQDIAQYEAAIASSLTKAHP